MLTDWQKIGERLFLYRKRIGLSQADVAEAAKISERAYAKIERGESNARTNTILQICGVLQITPDSLFQDEQASEDIGADIEAMLATCSPKELKTISRLIEAFLDSTR